MKVKIREEGGFAIELTGAEARVLLDELGSVPASNQKIRQLYRDLDQVLEVVGATRNGNGKASASAVAGTGRRPS
jgi:hypothetical protein